MVMTTPDYTFITDRLAIGNVTARSVPGWVAIVTLLATDRPGILWDELKTAPKVPNGVACDELGGVPVLHVDIADGESFRFGPGSHRLDDYLESAAAFIARHINAGCVLVHCGAGISRSAALVIAYLCRYTGMSYVEALGFVQTRRPQVAPADAFALAIKHWLRLDRLAERGPRCTE